MKQAIILGASSGIGEALARRLAGEGWRVAVTGRREDLLASLASEIGGVARLMDLGDPDAARLTLETLWREMGSVDLDGLRDLARKRNVPVAVTELCPGFVDTAMMKTDKPFWVATPEKTAAQMLDAIRKGKKCVYITRRWALVACLLRLLPRP